MLRSSQNIGEYISLAAWCVYSECVYVYIYIYAKGYGSQKDEQVCGVHCKGLFNMPIN